MFIITPPPTRWWRRAVYWGFLPVWPRWLAQWLCPHEFLSPLCWGHHKFESACRDCGKFVMKENLCKHPCDKIKETAWVEGKPASWKCGVCGFPFLGHEYCPDCTNAIQPMNVVGYVGMFPSSFHCTQCGKYMFHEEL